jgi:PAS domain S-box-containing protein
MAPPLTDAQRLLLDGASDEAVVMLDREGRVASWNVGAERIQGYQAAEIVGEHLSRFYPPGDVDAGEPERALAIATEAGRVVDEGWRLRKDGPPFWANVVITALRDASGRLEGFAKVTRDLTQRRAAAAELRRSEERFHYLVDAVTDYAIFMLDPAGHVETWNAGAKATKRYEAAEIIGRHFSVFYTPEDRAARKPELVLETAAREGRYEEEGWRVRRDGSRFWANVVVTALREESGELTGFAKITRDLSEQRAQQEALRGSEERFRLLVEGVEDYAIYMLDPTGHVSTWNSGAAKIKGYQSEEIIGQYYGIFFTPEHRREGHPETELETAASTGRFEEEGWRVKKDGSRFWANVVVTAVRNASGELLGFAKVTRDLTMARAAEETARELIRVQTARATAQEAEGRLREERERYMALSHRLEVILEGVADGITVQDASGGLIFANTAAARFCGAASAEELLRATPAEISARFELLDEQGRAFDPRELPGRKVLGGLPSATSLLRIRDRISGKEPWALVRASAVKDADGRTELAVNIWHDVSEDRRREERDRHLARATVTLSSSLDYELTLSNLAGLLAPGLADWCSIHLLEGEQLKHVGLAHVDPAKVALAHEFEKKYPPDLGRSRGIGHVLRTGESALYAEIPEELLAQEDLDAERLQFIRAVGMKSVILVPIRVGDRISGTMSLISAEGGRVYDRHDVALAEEIGRRAGTSIENARLYAAEKKARAHLELVARAGEALAGTLDYEETLRTVVGISLPALADFAFFDVVEGAEVRRIAAAHEDAEVGALLRSTLWLRSERRDKNLCALSSGELGIHPQIDDAWMLDVATGPEHLDLLRRVHLCSMVTVPLRSRGELLGALTLCYGKSGRHHTPDDAKLAEELARRASVAVIQARLYEQAQAAVTRAEEASRVKDEFLATVSHELRTPLNAILGWASLLGDPSTKAPLAKGIDVIHRNAKAQAKIVDDILDVSRIITGRLRLEIGPVDLVMIVRDAIEVVRPSADAKALAIEFTSPPEPCVVIADPDRLQQVVWNLLSNAVKFTDAGGNIRIAVERALATLVLSVADTGRGIDPAFLPYVFEPFKQADGSTTRRVGGLGLGLAIVRHLVELHGGQAHAHSAGVGAGATFSIALPVRAVVPALREAERSPSRASGRGAPSARSLAGVRLLVVDDEPDARDLVQAVLERAGGKVATAASASEGFALLQELRPDVLVSDIGMPGEDGYAFMRRIRTLAPAKGGAIPSVALTAYTRSEDKEKALSVGFTAHIGKPVDPADLLATVASLAMRPRLAR